MAQNFLSDIKLGDSIYIRLGDRSGGDLNLYHNGTNTFIDNHTGQLYIRNFSDDKNIHLQSDDGSGGMTDYIVVHGSENIVKFQEHTRHLDNKQARFGTGSDLKIFHDGTNNQIRNEGGSLDFEQHVDDGTIRFYNDNGSGGQALYFYLDGSTVRTQFNKQAYFIDNAKVTFGDSEDLQIYHNGSNSYIENDTGHFYIKNRADDGDIVFQSDDGGGGTAEYFRLDGGIARTVFSKDTKHEDSVKAFFGSGYDLEIYHDGSHSYLDELGTGDFRIRSNSAIALLSNSNEDMVLAVPNSYVKLFFNNSEKLATTSAGVTITGALTTTTGTSSIYNRLTISDGTNQINIGQWDGANHRMEFDSNRPTLITSYQGNINLGISGGTTLNITSSGINITGNLDTPNISINDYVKHNGDTDTYFGFPAANTFSIGTGGTERMRVDNTGEVKIGKSIHLGSDSGVLTPAQYSMLIEAPSGSETDINMYTHGSSVFNINSNGTAAKIGWGSSQTRQVNLVNTGTGNIQVGIGTTSPAQQLHVVGTQIRLDNNSGAGGGYYLHDGSGTFRAALWDNGTDTRLFADGNGSTAAITIDSNNTTFAGTIASGNIAVTGGGGGNGQVDITRTSGASIRLQSQSALAKFGTTTNHGVQFMTNDTGRWNIQADGDIVPVASTYDIGSSGGHKPANVYATNFHGDGSNLTGVTSEWDGTLTGNATITGDLTIGGTGGIFMPEYLYHVGDTNTYFGFPAADEYKVTVGGSTKIFADVNAAYLYHGGNQKLRTTSTGVTVTGGVVAAGNMSSFETTLTNNDDWQNSPISILERANIGTGSADDKYSPNLNFHWSGRVSRSLWMDATGNLNYGEYDSNGSPGYSNGIFRVQEMHASVFKDKDSTGYYLDPANTGTSLNVAGAATFAGAITTNANNTFKSAAGSGSAIELNLIGTNTSGFGSSHVVRSRIKTVTDDSTNAYASKLEFYTNDASNNLDLALKLDSSQNATFAGDVTVTGDFQVNGTTTTVNATNLDLSDNIIGLNRGASSNSNDSGLIIERGSTGNNAAMIWDEANDRFVFGLTTSTPAATGSVSISSTSNLAARDLDVNTITSGAITVAGGSDQTVIDADIAFDLTDGSKDTLLITNNKTTSAIGAIGPSIGFGNMNSDRRTSAIGAIRTGGDHDQMGLAFFTHPGTGNDDTVVKKLELAHDGTATFAGAVSIDGKLTLDAGSLTNGIINTPASLRINIDSNNNNTGEKFVVGHNQDSINNNNELFVVEESGNATFAGQINAIGGSAGAPSIIFEGDSDTGFYHASSNAIDIATQGAHRVRINNTGVGIGTNNPDESLHIKNSDGANIILNSDANTNDSGIYMSEGADATPTQNGAYVYYDASENAFKIATGGSSLTDRLTIARDTGDATFAGDITVNGGDFNLTKQNGSPYINMLYDGTNPGTNTLLHYFNFRVDYDGAHQDWGGIEHRTNASAVRTDLRFNVKSTSGNVQTGLAIRGQASAAPLVGIGTSDPDAKLEILGNGRTNSTTSLRVRSDDDQQLFYVRDDGVVSVTHNYFYVDNTAGMYSNGVVYARGGVSDDGGPLQLGGNSAVGNLTLTSNTSALFNGDVHLDTLGSMISFYGNSSGDHAIMSKNLSGNADDDIRINSYGGVFINLDSNGNNDDNADFKIVRHGSTGAVSASDTLLSLKHENAQLTVGRSATGQVVHGSKSVGVGENTFTTVLTVSLANHTSCYVKIFGTGDWSSHSAVTYLGEFFLQNGANGYNEPGMIIREVDNTKTDAIVAKIVDPTGTSNPKNFEIQLKADDTVAAVGPTIKITYEVMGVFSAVS